MNLKTRQDTHQGFVWFIIPAQHGSTSLVSHRSSQDSTQTSLVYLPPNCGGWGGRNLQDSPTTKVEIIQLASKSGSIYPRNNIEGRFTGFNTHGPMPNPQCSTRAWDEG